MKLGGWSRIWIALSLLYAAPVVLLAYEQRPTEEIILDEWVSKASDVIALRISSAERATIIAPDVQRHFFSGKSNQESVQWLQEIANHPKKPSQLTFTSDIAEINAKYQARLDSLPRDRFEFYATAFFLWWLLPVFLILGFGLVTRWIARGFRHGAV